MQNGNYIVNSLELHLFFCRIMKEHSLFLWAGFTPAGADFAKQAEHFKNEFENLLAQAVRLGGGIVSREVLQSCELVTEFTDAAEKQTECLTSIPINRCITAEELRLCGECPKSCDIPDLFCHVRTLNQRALRLLDGLIAFKERTLKCVLDCELFTVNYPLLIEHIIREAKLYRKYIFTLQKNGEISRRMMQDTECFWNRIMMEHAMFIRGLLDPCETELFCTADGFSKEYAQLLKQCDCANANINEHSTLRACSIEQTEKFRDLKAAGAKGIIDCKIRSVILPLLADHVLREANHYLRLLKS